MLQVQGRHFTVQCQDFQAGAQIIVGYEAVEQARLAGRIKRLQDGVPVQRRDQSATQNLKESLGCVAPGYLVVVLSGDVCFADDLVRGKYLRAGID